MFPESHRFATIVTEYAFLTKKSGADLNVNTPSITSKLSASVPESVIVTSSPSTSEIFTSETLVLPSTIVAEV
jgi:hypothetical protein